MLTLNDGRSELWQWDTGRKLTVDADCTQVHFSNKFFGRSVDVDVVGGTAEIPDALLQVDKELLVWAFVGTAENGYTKISKVFKVNKRNKPADYVFTPTEQTTLDEIMKRLDRIEESQDPDAIKNAVDDYLANNPIQIKETDPTVSQWAKQPEKPNYTAEEVGALPADTVIPEIPAIPSKLPNPNALSFTGAVNATYDGSAPLTVNIPEGGGGTGGGGSGGELAKTIIVNDTLAEAVKSYERTLTAEENELIKTAKKIVLMLKTSSSAYELKGVGLQLWSNYSVYFQAISNGTLSMGSNTWQYAISITDNSVNGYQVTFKGSGTVGVRNGSDIVISANDLSTFGKLPVKLQASTSTDGGFPVGTKISLEVYL